MNPTIRDIATALGISHTTVSRALNGKGETFISDATRRRVLDAAAAMNYQPNRAARALATGRTGLIGVWVEDLTSPDFVRLTSHAVKQLKGLAYDPVVREMDRLERTIESVAAWQVDGILAVEGMRFLNRLLNAPVPSYPPIVHIGAFPVESVDHVRVDLWSGTQEAVRHLLKIGCRRVACVTNFWLGRPGEPRHDAYAAVVQEAGLPEEFIVVPDDERANAREVVYDYVRSNACPDGLFCVHDGLAMGTYRALRDAGIRIPEDCALIGCDGLDDMAYFDPPISTLVYPADEMCTLAWKLLKERMDQPDLPVRQETLPARLVLRASAQRG